MYQDVSQQIENTAKAVVNDIHTALPGRIVSFDPERGVASVQPKGKYRTTDGATMEYPIISEAPVTYPYCQTANVGVIFPVKPGDSCMIIVSEVELDEWRNGGESEAPVRYNLTSAMLIPGLCLGGASAMRKAVENDAVVIASGDVDIVLGKGRIAVTGDMTVKGNVSVEGNFDMSGNATVRGNHEVSGSVTTGGNLTVKSGASVTGSISVGGSQTVGGNQTVSGRLTAGGINMNTHKHGGVESGGSYTRGPE